MLFGHNLIRYDVTTYLEHWSLLWILFIPSCMTIPYNEYCLYQVSWQYRKLFWKYRLKNVKKMLFGHHVDTLIGCGLGQNRSPYIFTRWKFETLYSRAESLKPYIHELKVWNPIFTRAESLKPYIHELKVWNPIFTRAESSVKKENIIGVLFL